MADIDLTAGVESATLSDQAGLNFDPMFLAGVIDKGTVRDQLTVRLDIVQLYIADIMSAVDSTLRQYGYLLSSGNKDTNTVKDRATVFVGEENRHKFSAKGSPFYSRGCPFFS